MPLSFTALAATAALVLTATAVDEEEALEQQIDADQAIVDDQASLVAGHVDVGPRFVDGDTWRLLIHDDAARDDSEATSVWRYPDRTVFEVVDDAILTVPDDPAYSFIDAEPGTNVWVLPQTQHPDVVWLGWNTQDPLVMESIDRGITLTLIGFSGPGSLAMYLQSGTFGEPQVLWDSAAERSQPMWVDVNTHTHANWVFTEPGVYMVALRAEADLVDGSSVSDEQVLRFAVGSQTSAADAFAASAEHLGFPVDEQEAGETGDVATTDEEGADGVSTGVVLAIAAIMLLAAVTVIVILVRRGARTKREVLG